MPAIEARLTIQPFVLAQVRDRGLGDEHEPAQVDRQLPVDVLHLGVLEPARDADAGRVDEHVETALALDVLRDHAGAVLRLGDVRDGRVRAELGGGRLDLLGRPRGEREGVPLVAEHARDREPDPGGAAGDER